MSGTRSGTKISNKLDPAEERRPPVAPRLVPQQRCEIEDFSIFQFSNSLIIICGKKKCRNIVDEEEVHEFSEREPTHTGPDLFTIAMGNGRQ